MKKHTVATFGRLGQLGGELDSVISGLLKASGREGLGAKPAAPSATNTPDQAPDAIVARYKSLADIERGFEVLKSELEVGPV